MNTMSVSNRKMLNYIKLSWKGERFINKTKNFLKKVKKARLKIILKTETKSKKFLIYDE